MCIKKIIVSNYLILEDFFIITVYNIKVLRMKIKINTRLSSHNMGAGSLLPFIETCLTEIYLYSYIKYV